MVGDGRIGGRVLKESGADAEASLVGIATSRLIIGVVIFLGLNIGGQKRLEGVLAIARSAPPCVKVVH